MPGRNACSGTIPAIVARAAACAAVCATLAACSATTPPPGGRLTARQQILATEAIDSALAQVRWPKLDGRSVFVEIGAPSEDDERAYLKNAVSAALAENGARLAPDVESADYVLLVLGKAVGVDEERTFFGIPALERSSTRRQGAYVA